MPVALVIDTALNACQVGVFGHKDGSVYPIETLSEAMTRGHQEFIGPAVLQCFEKSGISPREVSVFGVTIGPGSFTGLRVGLSFAKGLAVGAGTRLRGFSTLEMMGRAQAFAGRERLVVHDAGRGQVYVQRLDAQDKAYAPVSYDIENITEIEVTATPEFLIGSAASRLAGRFAQAQIIAEALPDLTAMARLCFADTVDYDDLTPLYMREADAKVSDKAVVRFS